MLNLKTYLYLLFFFICVNLSAQEFEIGKVSVAELEEKRHPKDTSAVAAILFEKGKVDFDYSQNEGFQMFTKVSVRIKIYKKDGYSWGNKAVQYYIGTGTSKETVSFSDVATYNLVNGKIEKTKLKSDGTFDENVNRYWSAKKIVLPNIKVGSVIEYSYVVRSKRYGALADWTFQSSIPVNYSEFKTEIPEYFLYNTNLKGFIAPTRTVVNDRKKIDYTYRESNTNSRGAFNTSEQGRSNVSNESLEFGLLKTTYVTKDLPAMKEEVFVNNVDNYRAAVSHELASVRFPNTPFQDLSTNWETVTKTIYEYDDFGPELNKTGYFEDELKGVLAGLNTEAEKIDAIFNHVKSKMVWNNYLGYSCNDGVKTANKNKSGNSAEINLMLTAMLRFAGITANPVLVSTRSNGIALFASRNAFNYVIAAVESAEGLVLLDATDKFAVPNILPTRDLNWLGRLIRKDGTSIEVDLMPKLVSNDVITLMYKVEPTGAVIGKMRRQQSDYNAKLYRAQVSDENEDTYLEKLENQYSKIEIDQYKRDNEKELKMPVVESFSFKGSSICEVIQENIYINPLLFFTVKENPFKQEKREFPVDYSYPFLDKYNLIIEIPEGYKVESLPPSISLSMQDGFGSFKYMSSSSENKIIIGVQHQINEAIVPSEYYGMIKEYYQKMIDKQNEKIVLKKI